MAALIISGVLTLWGLVAPQEKALPRAMGVTVSLYILIPSFGPPRMITAIPLLASILLFGLAMLRTPAPQVRHTGTLLIVVFVVFYSATWISNDSIQSLGLIAARVLSLVLVAIAAVRLRNQEQPAAIIAILAFVPVEAVLTLLEQAKIVPYVWARDETSTYLDIANRQNELAAFLPGRSMGTFAHPILLGTYAAVAVVLCILAFAATRRPGYLLLAVTAAGTLVLSGTRSAAAAAIVAIVLWLLLRPGRQLLLKTLLCVGVAIAALNFDTVMAKLFNSTIVGSVSYVHRTRVLSSVPNLLARDDLTWLFGSGAGRIQGLFDTGVVSGYGTYLFFDNMYVCLLAVSGVVGLALFAAVAIRALFIGDGTSRIILILILVMMASFDTLTWNFSFLLTVLALGSGLALPGRKARPATPTGAADLPEPTTRHRAHASISSPGTRPPR